MSEFFKNLKHTIDVTVPDADEFTHGKHPKIDYVLLVLRNLFAAVAAILLVISIILHRPHDVFKAIAYFCGAAAYLFELLAVTDCFQTKVPHSEMFMIYCFGPLYIIMGLSYVI